MNHAAVIISLAALVVVLFIHQLILRRRFAVAEKSAREQAARLSADLAAAREERNRLLDALTDSFLLLDSTGQVLFANAAARRLFAPRQLVGRSYREVFLESRLTAAVETCIQTGVTTTDFVVFSSQGSSLGSAETRGPKAWVIDASPLPFPADSGHTIRVLIRDVTAEYQAEQVRKDFVANASHELRTPLTIISGYLENLLDENTIDEPALARRHLAIMRKHSDRISRIVEDMLVISRLESGEAAALNLEPFPFGACVSDVVERLESLVHSQQATVRCELHDKDFVLHGDRFYWTQVLFNLVENALKQNPQPDLTIVIASRDAGSHLEISVTDDGIGIPGADLPHIFRRFYRVEKHHSQREIRGTGLGLSIVKRAVEAHHGTIQAASVPGRETKFTILIPATPK
ncbi:MAG: ATP-binding protein [Verrucomicrobiota bacterium]